MDETSKTNQDAPQAIGQHSGGEAGITSNPSATLRTSKGERRLSPSSPDASAIHHGFQHDKGVPPHSISPTLGRDEDAPQMLQPSIRSPALPRRASSMTTGATPLSFILSHGGARRLWIPAFAGMTRNKGLEKR
jgi:hypothetical protein